MLNINDKECLGSNFCLSEVVKNKSLNIKRFYESGTQEDISSIVNKMQSGENDYA